MALVKPTSDPVVRLESNGAAGVTIAQVYNPLPVGQHEVYLKPGLNMELPEILDKPELRALAKSEIMAKLRELEADLRVINQKEQKEKANRISILDALITQKETELQELKRERRNVGPLKRGSQNRFTEAEIEAADRICRHRATAFKPKGGPVTIKEAARELGIQLTDRIWRKVTTSTHKHIP